MKCPICKTDTKVIKTDKYDTFIKRIRQCPKCKWSHTSEEYFPTDEEIKQSLHA